MIKLKYAHLSKLPVFFSCLYLSLQLLIVLPSKADTWRYAMEESLTEIQGVYASKFKEIIEKNSAHKVLIYPFGTLGESTDLLEQAQAGLLQFVDQSPGFIGTLIPEAQVFLLPYVLPEKHCEIAYFFKHSKTIHQTFHRLYGEQDLELLSMFPEGNVAITTREVFRSKEDLSGMKIRVMSSPLLIETYKAFGAVPTPLPTGEIFGALQTNMIQGQENPWFYLESAKLYEVSNVITDIGHNLYTTAVMANKKFYERSTLTDQTLISRATKEATDFIIEYQRELEVSAKLAIKKAKPNIQYITLTDAEREPFRQSAKMVQTKFIDVTGPSGKAVLSQLLEDLNDAKNH
jgi:TRAP-type C4-dicarboxylate transport system substrate-binding protein